MNLFIEISIPVSIIFIRQLRLGKLFDSEEKLPKTARMCYTSDIAPDELMQFLGKWMTNYRIRDGIVVFLCCLAHRAAPLAVSLYGLSQFIFVIFVRADSYIVFLTTAQLLNRIGSFRLGYPNGCCLRFREAFACAVLNLIAADRSFLPGQFQCLGLGSRFETAHLADGWYRYKTVF